MPSSRNWCPQREHALLLITAPKHPSFFHYIWWCIFITCIKKKPMNIVFYNCNGQKLYSKSILFFRNMYCLKKVFLSTKTTFINAEILTRNKNAWKFIYQEVQNRANFLYPIIMRSQWFVTKLSTCKIWLTFFGWLHQKRYPNYYLFRPVVFQWFFTTPIKITKAKSI